MAMRAHADHSNVDPHELGKFDRAAKLWWDPDGKMGMLHVINPLRRDFVFGHIATPGPRIVDIGCGGGILTEAMARHGAQVLGIDLSQPTLDIAIAHARQAGLDIDYRLQSAEALAAEQAGSFDAVTCMEMLEHVPDPSAVIAACARLLKPGGQAFFSTINRNFKAWLFAIVGGEFVLRILPRGTHRYRMLIRPDEMRAWATSSGLRFLSSASLMYTPWNRTFRVVPGKEDVNYMAAFTKED